MSSSTAVLHADPTAAIGDDCAETVVRRRPQYAKLAELTDRTGA
jgi:hypothetical protein